MNFLGHFILAGEDEGLVVGNYIADFVKGKSYQDFPENIATGILMHREIDFFTDNHADFKLSKRRISGRHAHFSGVIIDIFYDHFLAADFENVAGIKLEIFAGRVYAVLEKYMPMLPQQSRHMFGYMKRDNWLKRYEELDGIERTLTGMSKRIKVENQLDDAISDLKRNYSDMKLDFERFISEAIENFKSYK